MTRDLALKSPESIVGDEDAMAEEIWEDGVEALAFDVVGEVGAEEMVDDGGVGFADAVVEAERAGDLDGVGWGGGE